MIRIPSINFFELDKENIEDWINLFALFALYNSDNIIINLTCKYFIAILHHKSINIISKNILLEQKLERDIKRFDIYIALYKWHKFCRVFNQKISEISDPNISFYKKFYETSSLPKN